MPDEPVSSGILPELSVESGLPASFSWSAPLESSDCVEGVPLAGEDVLSALFAQAVMDTIKANVKMDSNNFLHYFLLTCCFTAALHHNMPVRRPQISASSWRTPHAPLQ